MKLDLVKKCYLYYHPDHQSHSDWLNLTIYADNYREAKKQLWQEIRDLGYYDIEYMDLIGGKSGFTLRHNRDGDQVRLPMAPVLEGLSPELVDVIRHTFGINESYAGLRNHFYGEDSDMRLMELVKLGLMTRYKDGWSDELGYYRLTDIGKEAAKSLLVGSRCTIEYELNARPVKANVDWLSLEDIACNPDSLIATVKVYIYSSEWGCYWRHNGCGYTASLSDAGIYDMADAYNRTSHCGPEKRIRYRLVDTSVINNKAA